jgi:hypothetical protein
MNPFAPKPRGRYTDVIETVKGWTRVAMGLDAADAVAVSEITCQIPGCPPRETVIVAMPVKGHWLKTSVHKPMPEVTEDDVVWSLREAERIPRADAYY